MAQSPQARKFRASVARIAIGEIGQTPCSRRTDDKPGYFTSCHEDGKSGPPQLWCADFVRWVWYKAGAINAAPGTTILTPAAASFVKYGRLRRKPRVGDAVLFGYQPDAKPAPTAAHIAIVVKVNAAEGTIVSVGGDEGGEPGTDAHFAVTARVIQDGPYNSKPQTTGPGAPSGPLSGYVSPVEDDMPYTKKQIQNMVQKGVAAELHTKLDGSGITAAQGAEAAVQAQQAIAQLQAQVAELKQMVQQALTPPAPPAP